MPQHSDPAPHAPATGRRMLASTSNTRKVAVPGVGNTVREIEPHVAVGVQHKPCDRRGLRGQPPGNPAAMQPPEPFAQRLIGRGTAADANIFPASLSISTRPPEPAAFLTMDLEIVRASSTFWDFKTLASPYKLRSRMVSRENSRRGEGLSIRALAALPGRALSVPALRKIQLPVQLLRPVALGTLLRLLAWRAIDTSYKSPNPIPP
jgi:hypothetical protein